MKKYSSALDTVKKALLLKPDNPYYTDTMGEVYEYMGENDKALELYEQSLKVLQKDDNKRAIEESEFHIKRVKEKINSNGK